MKYVRPTGEGQALTLNEIKRKHPAVSFPDKTDDAVLRSIGYEPVENQSKPEFKMYEEAVESAPVFENGRWVQRWEVRQALTVSEYRNLRRSEISSLFESAFSQGSFKSSLGFVADCRRNGMKNDRENLEGLLKLGKFPVRWKDAEGTEHALDEAACGVLLKEMISFALRLYQRKWAAEKALELAETYAETESIVF
jgi:hypothetical protein